MQVSIVIQREWTEPSNARILRLAGLDKHRWDNGRLKQLVALETTDGRSDLATLPDAIAACRKVFSSDPLRRFDRSCTYQRSSDPPVRFFSLNLFFSCTRVFLILFCSYRLFSIKFL